MISNNFWTIDPTKNIRISLKQELFTIYIKTNHLAYSSCKNRLLQKKRPTHKTHKIKHQRPQTHDPIRTKNKPPITITHFILLHSKFNSFYTHTHTQKSVFKIQKKGNVKLLSISIDNLYCQFKINKILF